MEIYLLSSLESFSKLSQVLWILSFPVAALSSLPDWLTDRMEADLRGWRWDQTGARPAVRLAETENLWSAAGLWARYSLVNCSTLRPARFAQAMPALQSPGFGGLVWSSPYSWCCARAVSAQAKESSLLEESGKCATIRAES